MLSCCAVATTVAAFSVAYNSKKVSWRLKNIYGEPVCGSRDCIRGLLRSVCRIPNPQTRVSACGTICMQQQGNNVFVIACKQRYFSGNGSKLNTHSYMANFIWVTRIPLNYSPKISESVFPIRTAKVSRGFFKVETFVCKTLFLEKGVLLLQQCLNLSFELDQCIFRKSRPTG